MWIKSSRCDEADWIEIQLHSEQCTLDKEKQTFTASKVKRIQILLPLRTKAECILNHRSVYMNSWSP